MNLKKLKYVSSGYEQIRHGKLFDLINIEPQKLCSTIKIPVLNFVDAGQTLAPTWATPVNGSMSFEFGRCFK